MMLCDVIGKGGKSAAVIRGPIVTRVINQLIASTSWGDLDYLVSQCATSHACLDVTLCALLCSRVVSCCCNNNVTV